MSEITYSNTSTSTASAYSLVGDDDLGVPSNETNPLIQSILGDNYREVDLLSASLVKGRGTIEDGGGILSPESNSSTYSTNSVTTNSTTLYTVQSDEIGNIINVNGIDLNWNGRRLDSISQNGTDLISYKYNIDGQRISKTYDGVTTEYFYNGDILAGQKQGDNVLVFMYDNNGDIFGFTYNGTPYYYLKNAQNDVWAIADELGEAVVIYQYDAWGVVTACYDISEENIATINPITYRSYYMDLELGFFMYYLNSRYYMADWGRFVSGDSYVQTGQGMLDKNMFAYCANNPVMFRDPSGCCYEITIPAVGNGPVIVTDSNGNSYSYNAPQIGNTYYFDAKDFQSDVVNGNVEKFLQPIIQTSAEYVGDNIAKGLMISLNDANLTYLIPYGHEITSISKGYGLVSLISTAYQLCWDFENYGNDPQMLVRSVGITAGFTLISIAAGAMIATSGLGIAATVVVSVGFGYVISKAEDETRKLLLN